MSIFSNTVLLLSVATLISCTSVSKRNIASNPHPQRDSLYTRCLKRQNQSKAFVRNGRFQISAPDSTCLEKTLHDNTVLIYEESDYTTLIKILRACDHNGNYWVFASSQTLFPITVKDLSTEIEKTYRTNPNDSPIINDTESFPCVINN